MIAQQKLVMEILTKDAEEMEHWVMQHTEVAIKSIIQRLKVSPLDILLIKLTLSKADKESEVVTFSWKYEMTLHKLHVCVHVGIPYLHYLHIVHTHT